jgi:signal transduction histidine kinase
MRPRRRRAAALLAAGGLTLGLTAAASWNPGVDPRIIAADLSVGWLYIGGGIAAWTLRRNTRSGVLLVAVGVAWFAGTIWPSLEFFHRGPLLHLLAVYPAGRLAWQSDPPGAVRAAAVLVAYLTNLSRLGGDPRVAASYALVLAALGAHTLVTTRGSLRRTRQVGAAAAVAVAGVVLAASLARLAGAPLGIAGLYAYEAVLMVAGLSLTLDLLAGDWSEAALAHAVVDLGDEARAGSVRERLARSLGDPSLKVGYALEGDPGSFVDELGRPVAVPPPSADCAIVPMVVAGRESGFLAGNPTLLADQRLVELLSSAAAVARSNSALQAEVRARVAEVAASRERLVHAADAERRRLESRLQRGAALRLERVGALLELVDVSQPAAQISHSRLREEVARARTELAELARGMHPAALTDRGLPSALADLATRAPIRTQLSIAMETADPMAAATVYFVCSEAIANTAKHAEATMVTISVHEAEGRLRVLIGDDGRGGARLTARGGLRGLVDRVEALGGRFELHSVAGAGTTLRVEVPLPNRARVASSGVVFPAAANSQ